MAMTLETIASQLEIRELVAHYSEAISRGNVADFLSTWAPDAEWEILGKHAKGHAELEAVLLSFTKGFAFVVQRVSGGELTIDGDRARGRWTVTENAKTLDGNAILAIALYRDDYRRIDGRWRFAHRRLVPIYMGPPDLSAPHFPIAEDA